jgi:8-oxo-dGTP pyrophosphatase MutT (NUDIX family)
VSVTAIVTRDDGRVLVIKRDDDGRWVPPGGVLELAETPQQACAREVLEETGYRVEVGPLTGVYKNMKLGVVSLAFRCVLVGGEARTSEESKAVSWRTLEEVKRDVPEARAVRVFDAMHASGVPVRIHDGSRLIESTSPGTVLQTALDNALNRANKLTNARLGTYSVRYHRHTAVCSWPQIVRSLALRLRVNEHCGLGG